MVTEWGAFRTQCALLWVLAACAACGGRAPHEAPTAGADTAADALEPLDLNFGEPEVDWLDEGSPPIAEPVIDWLEAGMPPVERPQLTPCPEGWREVAVDILEEGDQIVCDPWPETGREACTGVETHLPGEAGCRPVGSACPEGDWPENADGSALVADLYVRPDGAGDGFSPDSPLGSLQAALDALAGLGLAEGEVPVVALSKGSHSAALNIDQDLSLVGACAEETQVTDWIVAEGVSLGLQDLSFTEDDAIAVQTTGGDLSMRGVAVLGSKNSGVRTEDALVVLSDVVVRGTWGSSTTNSKVGAVWVTGGSLEASGLEIDDSWWAGLRLNESQATVTRLVVHDVVGEANVDFGIEDVTTYAGTGVDNWFGTIDLRESVLANADWCGMRNFSGSALVEDVLLQGQPSEPLGITRGGRGLCASGVAELFGARLWIKGINDLGIGLSYGEDEPIELDFSDLVVQDLGQEEESDSGSFFATNSSVTVSARIERVALSDLQTGGVYVVGDLTLSDVVAARLGCPAGSSAGAFGVLEGTGRIEGLIGVDVGCALVEAGSWGETTLSVSDMYIRGGDLPLGSDTVQGGMTAGPWGPATLNVERALVEGVAMAGVEVREATVNLTDVIFRGGEPPEAGVGVGGWLHDEADGTWERVVFEGHHGMGIAVEAGCRLTLRDVRITDSSSAVQDGRGGFGLWVDEDATVVAERLAITGSRGAGIWSSNAELVLTDVLVSGTGPAACYPATCDEAAASGVVLSGGEVSLGRFLVSANEGAGVQTISGAIDLSHGLSRGNHVGFDNHGGRVSSTALASEDNDLDQGELEAEVSGPFSPDDLGLESSW